MEVRVPIPARHKGLALPFAIQSSPAGTQSSPAGTGTTTITSSRRVAADRITTGEAASSPSPSRPDPLPAVRPLWVQWGAEIRSREVWSLLGLVSNPGSLYWMDSTQSIPDSSSCPLGAGSGFSCCVVRC